MSQNVNVDIISVNNIGIEQVIIEQIQSNSGLSSIPPSFTTYRIFIDMDDNYKLVKVFGTHSIPIHIEPGNEFYNNSMGESLGDLINPALFSLNPELQWDTYITMGAAGNGRIAVPYSVNPEGYIPETTEKTSTSPGLNLSMFDDTTSSAMFTIHEGSWGVPNGISFKNQGINENTIMIGQFTCSNNLVFEFNAEVIDMNNTSHISYGISNYNYEHPPVIKPINPGYDTQVTGDSFFTFEVETYSSSSTIASVEFFIDDLSIGFGTPGDNNRYTLEYMIPSTPDSITYYATATTNTGKKNSTLPITLSVWVDNFPLVLEPLPGTISTNDLPVTVGITPYPPSDTPEMQYVEYFANENSIGMAYSYPWSISWNPTPGTYEIYAVSTDINYETKSSAPITTEVIQEVFQEATQQSTPTNISTLSDTDGNLLQQVTVLDAQTEWILDNKVYVLDGQELHIEAGTVIKAAVGSGLAAPAIIVTRGAKIYAIGSKQAPIIITTVEDMLDGTYPVTNQGKWGGLVILGKAYNNLGGDDYLAVDKYQGEGYIENLDVPDDRHHFGRDYWEASDPDLGSNIPGTLKPNGDFNNNDNSGTIKYLSIRHAGANLGCCELNGLTLASVGKKTKLEYIEVISCQDDGIEFLGGTVDIKYAHILFCDDDYIDFDLGYTGRGQFIFGVQLPENTSSGYPREGDHGIEIDGDDDDHYKGDPSPEYFTNPTFYNCTFIGNQGADPGIEAKERAKGEISNSIFANFATGIRLATENDRPEDVYENFINETFVLKNNTFVGNSNYISSTSGGRIETIPQSTIDLLNATGNLIDNSLIDYILIINGSTDNSVDNAYNAVPEIGTASSNITPPIDNFFDATKYRGAFCPGAKPWTADWTYSKIIWTDNALNSLKCPGDVDSDGDVDATDLNSVLFNFTEGSCKK